MFFEGSIMPKLIDRAGMRYGRLMVLQQAGRSESKKVLWLCRCACGKEKRVTAGDLVTGNTVSCGCYLHERITRHGCSGKASYNTWRAMMRRCYKLHDKDYPRYGGRGVVVAPAWHDYLVFAQDVGEPEGAQTLDRIDTYGNYTKENCRWATPQTQNRNIRVRLTSKTGVIGVFMQGGKWYARLGACGKTYYSRACNSVELAAAERKKLESAHWTKA